LIEPGIVALLQADAPTAALVGARVYPLFLPDPCVRPAISYRVVSTVDTYTLDGPLSLVQVRLQTDCWGDTLASAAAVALCLKNLLRGYAGTLPNGVQVSLIRRDGQMSGYDEVELAYFVQSDWMIQYYE
jgi:hypothetical protein